MLSKYTIKSQHLKQCVSGARRDSSMEQNRQPRKTKLYVCMCICIHTNMWIHKIKERPQSNGKGKGYSINNAKMIYDSGK